MLELCPMLIGIRTDDGQILANDANRCAMLTANDHSFLEISLHISKTA